MRTLKKTLALVLVLAMMFSLCAVSASADFTDADEITYTEAADVMAMIGVIEGMPDGSFDAKGNLTRAQAAVMITRLLGAEDYAIATKGEFADVAANHWAAGAISFCVDAGIVEGYGDGNFGPSDELTGYQWAKMLLCAIGYNAKAEGMSGAAWQIAVAKLAAENGLFVGNLKGDKTVPATREEAALYGFNALGAQLVKYTGGNSITVGDITFTDGGNLVYLTKTVDGETVPYTFNDKYFDKLVCEDTGDYAADDFGRPGYTWVLYGKTAADNQYVWVGTDAYKTYTEGFNAKEVKALTDAKVSLAGATIYVNGVDASTLSGGAAIADADALAARNYVGTIVELYNTDLDAAIEAIVVVDAGMTTVTKVVSSYTAAKADKNYIEFTVKAHGTETKNVKIYDDLTAIPSDYDKLTAAYAKDDVLLTYWYGAHVQADYLLAWEDVAEVDVAKIDSTKLGASERGTIVADGKTYTMASIYSDGVPTLGEKGAGTLYIDANGYVVGYAAAVAAPKAVNYGIVLDYATKDGTAASNMTGAPAEAAYEKVQLVNAAGEKVILDTAFELDTDGLTIKKHIAKSVLTGSYKGTLAVYTLDANGKIASIELATETAGVPATYEKGKTFAVISGGSVYADDATVIFVEGKDAAGKTVYTVHTGYSKLPAGEYTAGQAYVYAYGADAVSVKLDEATLAYTDTQFAVITDGTPVVTASAKADYSIYTYAAIVDGKETTIAWEAKTAPANEVAGQLSTITFVEETGMVATFVKVEDGKAEIKSAAAGYYVTSAANYVDKDTVYYEVTFAVDGTVAGFEAVEGLTVPGATDTFKTYEYKAVDNKDDTAKAVVLFYVVADAVIEA